MNETCHTYISVMSHVNSWCDAHEWGIVTRIRGSCHTHVSKSWHTHECFMPHWMRHVTHLRHVAHVNESCTHMSKSCHICATFIKTTCRVTRMNVSCHTREWVMAHTWMLRFTQNIVSYPSHTNEWSMSHTWMNHITHMNEACHIYEWGMSHIINKA